MTALNPIYPQTSIWPKKEGEGGICFQGCQPGDPLKMHGGGATCFSPRRCLLPGYRGRALPNPTLLTRPSTPEIYARGTALLTRTQRNHACALRGRTSVAQPNNRQEEEKITSSYLGGVAEPLGAVLEVPQQQVGNLGTLDGQSQAFSCPFSFPFSSLGNASAGGAAHGTSRRLLLLLLRLLLLLSLLLLLLLLKDPGRVESREGDVDPLHNRGRGFFEWRRRRRRWRRCFAAAAVGALILA